MISSPPKVKKHNFSAGPSILPQEVLQKAAKAVIELDNTGLSLLEISHRSKEFIAIMEKARALVRELLGLPENYQVLFLQGGASLGFHLTPMNFLKDHGKAVYVKTGEWAKKAAKEAQFIGETAIIASSEDKNFNYVPKGYIIPKEADYLHLTSNNTIFGTQIKSFPESPIPVICDMSSDIFSRRINASEFAMIYAGAQKNVGPAGTTIYIINADFLGKTGRKIPTFLDLQQHIKSESMYNTPPVFAVYSCMLMLEWMKEKGGPGELEKINREKASLLYAEIDRNALFKGTAEAEDRSNMNVTFVLHDETKKEAFDQLWKAAGISGLPGHRSVGGYRASIYNAMPLASIQVLVDVMKDFEKKHG